MVSSTATATAESLSKRYRDAYRVTNAIITVGSLLKLAGIVLSGLILFFGIIVAQQGARQALTGLPPQAVIVVCVVVAAVLCFVFWLFGVLISAVGQMARSTVDTSVNTSPFLTDELRSQIMGL